MHLLHNLDSTLALSEEERLLLENVNKLAENKLRPNADQTDRTGAFPWDNIRAINELGLNAMFIPEAYGGSPLSYTAYLKCVHEISKACAATGIIWATNFHAMKPLIAFGSEVQKKQFLPRIAEGGLASLCITEPDAGSDATGMKTHFEPCDQHIMINGRKTFITSGDVADLYLLFGKWSDIEDPRSAISVLVLEKDTPGLRILGTEEKMGIRGSSTASLQFENCRVPRSHLLGKPGDGLEILFASLNGSRPSIAAHALGIARAAFEDSVNYINERQQSGRKIIEFQGIQFLLADLAAELTLCESWLWHVARLVDQGVEDISLEASLLKMRASDLAMRMTTDAVQLHGGYGFCRGLRVERLMRDAKITQIWEGTNQVHRQLLGRSFLQK
ncbi:MAG: acyl-CoA dehydrogenase family protein [Gammaproteobacteria bacterium]|nr:acyl-CoA dehydrogenase family protein [Gammaproteobacteria bacterium]